MNESPVTPADLTVLKLAVNGHQVSWIAEAAQTSIANVQTVLTTYGPTRDDWQNAIDAHEQRPFDLPDGRPERTTVTRIDNRGQAEPPRLALVPPSPEPAMPEPRINVPCTTANCGDVLTGGGAPRGWVLVRVIGAGAPRRYCDPVCAVLALTNPRPVAAVPPTPAPAQTSKGQPRQRAVSTVRISADQVWREALAALGKTSADVRVWCAGRPGLGIPARGPIPTHARDAYLAAHTTTGAQTG